MVSDSACSSRAIEQSETGTVHAPQRQCIGLDIDLVFWIGPHQAHSPSISLPDCVPLHCMAPVLACQVRPCHTVCWNGPAPACVPQLQHPASHIQPWHLVPSAGHLRHAVLTCTLREDFFAFLGHSKYRMHVILGAYYTQENMIYKGVTVIVDPTITFWLVSHDTVVVHLQLTPVPPALKCAHVPLIMCAASHLYPFPVFYRHMWYVKLWNCKL